METRIAAALLVLLLALATGAEAQALRWSQKTNATTVSLDVSQGGDLVVEGRQAALYLYDRAGNTLWIQSLADISRAAISSDGGRIAVAAGGKVILMDRSGANLWQYGEGGVRFVSVDISRDQVVAGTAGGRLVALSLLGQLLWSKPLCSSIREVSFTPDETSLTVAASTCVYLLDSRGNERLNRTRSDEVATAAALGDRLVWALRSGTVESAALQGSSWRVSAEAHPSALAAGPRGFFLLASGWSLYMLSESGSVFFQWASPIDNQTGPLQDAALSPDGSVLALAAPGNLTVWENLPPPPAPPSPSPSSASPTPPVRVYICPDGSEVADKSLCPSPKPGSSSPLPVSPPPSPSLPPAPDSSSPGLPVVPIVAAAAGVAGVVFTVRYVRKNREAIDRWRIERRMRRI